MNNKRFLDEEFILDSIAQEKIDDEFDTPVKTLSQMQNMPQQQQNFGFSQSSTMRVMPTQEELDRINNLLQSINDDAQNNNMFNEKPVVVETPVAPVNEKVTQAALSFEEELIRKLNAKSKPEIKPEERKEPVCVESTITSITDLLCGFSKEVEKTNIFGDEPVKFNAPNNILVRVNLPNKPQQPQQHFNFDSTIILNSGQPVPAQPNVTMIQQQPQQPQQHGMNMADIVARELEQQRYLEAEQKKNKPSMTMVSAFEDLPQLDLYDEPVEEKVGMQISFTSDISHDLLDTVDIDNDYVPQMSTNVDFDDIIGDLLDGKNKEDISTQFTETKLQEINPELLNSLDDNIRVNNVKIETPIISSFDIDPDLLSLDEPKEVKVQEEIEIPVLTTFDIDPELLSYEEPKKEVVEEIEQPVFDRTFTAGPDDFVLGVEDFVEEKIEVQSKPSTYEPQYDLSGIFDEEPFEIDEPLPTIEQLQDENYNDNNYIEEQQMIQSVETYEQDYNLTGIFDEEPFEIDEPLPTYEQLQEQSINQEEQIQTYEQDYNDYQIGSDDKIEIQVQSEQQIQEINEVPQEIHEIYENSFSSDEIIENNIESKILFFPRKITQTISPKDSMTIDDEPLMFVPRNTFPTVSAFDCMDLNETNVTPVKQVIKRTTITTTTKPKPLNVENVLFNNDSVKEEKVDTQEPISLVEEQVVMNEQVQIIEEQQIVVPQEVRVTEEQVQMIEEQHVVEQTDIIEEIDLSDIFATEEQETQDSFEEVDTTNLTLSFDDMYIDAVEDVNVVTTPLLEEELDLGDIFVDETYDSLEEEVITKQEEDFFQEGLLFDEVSNQIIEEEVKETKCNVFDCNGNELNKDEFIEEYVNQCNIFDINGIKLNRDNIYEKMANDEIVVFDRFGIYVIRMILLRDISAALQSKDTENEVFSNVYNEFKKAVVKDELIKEYHTNDPHLYTANQVRLSKEEILQKLDTGELVIGEYGKLVDKVELIKALKDTKTSIFNKYNEELTKEQLINYIKEGMDVYDKYENYLTNTSLCIKIDSSLVVIKDEKGIQVSKDTLLKEVFGFLDIFNANQERMSKKVLVMYLNNNNLNIYDKNNELLTKSQIIKIMNDNKIPMSDEHKVLLLGANSNVFDELGNNLNKDAFVKEFRNVLPRIYNIDGKKFIKSEIINAINEEIIIVVQDKVVVKKDELIKELKTNIFGVFTKDKEELSQEELISIVNTDQVYDYNGNVLSRKDLITKVYHSELIINDLSGKNNIEFLVNELRKNYIGVYDIYGNQLTKEGLVSQVTANNKALFDETKSLLSNDEINQLLILNNVDVTQFEQYFQTRNDKRDFIDINKEDNFVYTGDIYLETPNIVLARKDIDRLVITSYIESFEARLNMTDDSIKDLYTLLKNKLLSYNKVKSKTSWEFESYTHGKFQFAKIDIENDKIYLYLPLNWNDFIGTKYKYKDCSNQKNFEVTCLRFRIMSLTELRDCFELINIIASHIHASLLKDFAMINYYEKNKGFEALLREELIKEVINSKKYSNLKEIDKTSLINNDITNINIDVIKDIPLNGDLYNEVISNIAVVQKPGKKAIVNIDTISKMYHHEEIVSVETLKAKRIIADNISYVKVIARGSLEKKLNFEVQEYSKDAIKMILLTSGSIK